MNVHDVVQDMHAMCIEDDMYGSFMDVQGGSFTDMQGSFTDMYGMCIEEDMYMGTAR